MFTKLWSDPEIAGRIFLQAQMLFAGELVGAQKDRLYGDILADVMHKLSAMRYHLDAYRALEQTLYEDHRRQFQLDTNVNAECFPLIFTFEAFLFQMKSALDMVVKTLSVVPLKNQVATSTYGDKGDLAIKGLRANQEVLRKLAARGNLCAGELGIARIQALIDIMETARETWLREAVDMRDGVSHFRAAKSFVFTVFSTSEGTIDAALPVFFRNGAKIEPLAFMERLYSTCVEYCQDFICRTLNIVQPRFDLAVADPLRAAAIGGAQHAAFIKWEWTMNGEIVRGYLRTPSA